MRKSADLLLLLFSAGLWLACAPTDDKGQTPVSTDGTDSSADTTATTDETGTGDSSDTGETGEDNCGELVCKGHGSCQETDDGAVCVCDEGYVLTDPMGTECVVDETCVELRLLEEKCRQLLNDAPAVSVFFAIDFCSGDAVLPEKLEELGIDEFLVLENGMDIKLNPESNSAVIDKSVESFVTLVIDVSDSITGSEDLPALVTALREFVAQLEPAQGEARTTVEILVFGRNVARYLPMTTDFDQVDQALQTLQDDPQSVVALVSGMGTSLYDAVQEGIETTTRARQLRSAVSNDGILSTGTVVVVTDGKDTSNGSLDTGLVDSTLNQVISVGISGDIDGEDLDAIGRDGSFLAPDPSDWATAFAEIAVRVDQYPDRAYLLAYCSSTNQGGPEVTVSLEAFEPAEVATCKFDADLFASLPPACGPELFEGECDDKECGGWLTGCGGCADSQCCAGTTCTPAGIASDCNEQDALCNATDQICVPDAVEEDLEVCQDPPGVGDPCTVLNGSDYACSPGASYCQDDDELPNFETCLPAIPPGQACEFGVQCTTLHCDRSNPDNPNEAKTCQPPAEIFDDCGGGKAICEAGAYCTSECTARKKESSETCSNDEECRSGICLGDPKVCVPSGVCYWTWDEKATN